MDKLSAGKLYLVPSPLDFGLSKQVSLSQVLPAGTLQTASKIAYWISESAKSTRSYLKRINELHGLSVPLQQQQIVELPHRVHKKRGPSRRI